MVRTIPRSGFYGLLNPSGGVRREHFPDGPFPQPMQLTGPFWSTAWPADDRYVVCHRDENIELAFHGELYNIPSLRRQLDAAGDLPLNELLLLAYKHWSIDFLQRLDGQFVLALKDGEHLSLYRDSSGARSLYYAARPEGRIAYATRLEILLGLPGVQKQIARRSLHEYLRFLDITAPNTIYENVFALEAGQLLTWTAGRQDLRHPEAGGNTAPAPTGFDAAVSKLDNLMQQSIGNRLTDSERPAAFLSGGIDSSLICALAAKSFPQITAVTVGFEIPQFDEAPIARNMAAHLGIGHQVLHFSHHDYLNAFETFHRQSEQPAADPAASATLLAFDYCKERFDTVLDGSGADESLGTIPPHHVQIGLEYAALLPASLRRKITATLRHLPAMSGYAPIFDFEHPAELLIRWHGFSLPEIEALCGEPVSLEHTRFFQAFSRYPRKAHFERSIALLDAMPGDRLHQSADISGLNVRYPFMESSLDRFIRSLPPDYRYRQNEPKRILRSLLAQYVPESLWNIPKHGFNFPLLEFLSAENYALVRRYLDKNRWRQWDILNAEAVENHAHRFIAGEVQLKFRIWALIVLAIWMEANLDQGKNTPK